MTLCERRRKACPSPRPPHPPATVGGRRTVLPVRGTRSDGPESGGPKGPGHWSEDRAGWGRAEQSGPRSPAGGTAAGSLWADSPLRLPSVSRASVPTPAPGAVRTKNGSRVVEAERQQAARALGQNSVPNTPTWVPRGQRGDWPRGPLQDKRNKENVLIGAPDWLLVGNTGSPGPRGPQLCPELNDHHSVQRAAPAHLHMHTPRFLVGIHGECG